MAASRQIRKCTGCSCRSAYQDLRGRERKNGDNFPLTVALFLGVLNSKQRIAALRKATSSYSYFAVCQGKKTSFALCLKELIARVRFLRSFVVVPLTLFASLLLALAFSSRILSQLTESYGLFLWKIGASMEVILCCCLREAVPYKTLSRHFQSTSRKSASSNQSP